MKRIGLSLLFLVSISISLFADQRYYVWTYQALIEPEGDLEMEYYLTLKAPDRDDWDLNVWEHQLEIEYGISRHWDVGVYQVFEDKNDSFRYKGFKIRTRYLPWERNRNPVDFVLYLEYGRERDFHAPNKGEVKLIFGREYSSLDWAFNYTGEYKFAPGSEFEHKLQMALSIPVVSGFRLGVESFTIFEEDETSYYLGPTVAIGHHDFWVALNIAPGLNDASDDIRARMIMGISFR